MLFGLFGFVCFMFGSLVVVFLLFGCVGVVFCCGVLGIGLVMCDVGFVGCWVGLGWVGVVFVVFSVGWWCGLWVFFLGLEGVFFWWVYFRVN